VENLRFATLLAPQLRPLYAAATDAVGAALGVAATLTTGNYEGYLADRYDVAFICSLPYVMFERAGSVPAVPVAAPVLDDARYGAAPVYYSDVIVNAASPFESFGDLRARSWAYNEVLSQSGYGIIRYHLARLGETGGYFKDVVRSGSHASSLRMVAEGRVDGAAVDSHLLEVTLQTRPELLQQLRIIDQLGPSTIQPVVVSQRVPSHVRDRIGEVLVNMHTLPPAATTLAGVAVARFVPVEPGSYDDVRAMVDTCEANNFTVLR